ncbi:MAG TPA: hypothetical protein VGH54_21410 [Mycobacterium sp.]|jgi:hypothetical protein|uniref:hypothetical protein n=1 Tax=Mycobacterium sp. TaxID=1785 RepID=UPI002F408922
MSDRRKPPILRQGGLTGRVYVITAYTVEYGPNGEHLSETARTKFDVTEQYLAIAGDERSRAIDEVLAAIDEIPPGSYADDPAYLTGISRAYQAAANLRARL